MVNLWLPWFNYNNNVLFVVIKHCLCLQGRLTFVEILVLKVVCVLCLQSNVRNCHSDCCSQMFWCIQYLEVCVLKEASLNTEFDGVRAQTLLFGEVL